MSALACLLRDLKRLALLTYFYERKTREHEAAVWTTADRLFVGHQTLRALIKEWDPESQASTHSTRARAAS